jgi:hypothetical protein
MPVGDSLSTSFNQDDAEKQRSTHPKLDAQAAGLKKKLSMDQVQHAKIGVEVAYTKGQGTIVRKDGEYLTIFNEQANAYDQVHAGETYIPGDTISMGIMNQLWDQMTMETRMSALHKARIEEPLHFISKSWHELPMNLKEVLKKSPPYTSVGSHFQGKAPKGAVRDGGAARRPGTGPKSLGSADASQDATATTGQTKRTKPNRVYRDDVKNPGKKISITERQGKLYDNAYPKSLQDDKNFTPGATIVGGKQVGNSNTEKPKDSPKKETKPKGDAGAGTFAQGLDKATVQIYALRNHLNKINITSKEANSSLKSDEEVRSRDEEIGSQHSSHNTPTKPDKKVGGWEERSAGRNGGKLLAESGTIGVIGSKNPFKVPGIGSKKSDVEHGAYGGVVTDTPFDAPDDYEECSREGNRAQNLHNTQQKKPRDPKADGKEVMVGYHKKTIKQGMVDNEVEKEGGGATSAGAVTSSTEGVSNTVYNREDKHKGTSRWGPRVVSGEEAKEIHNRLNK